MKDNEFIIKTTIRTIILLFLSIDLSYFPNESSNYYSPIKGAYK